MGLVFRYWFFSINMIIGSAKFGIIGSDFSRKIILKLALPPQLATFMHNDELSQIGKIVSIIAGILGVIISLAQFQGEKKSDETKTSQEYADRITEWRRIVYEKRKTETCHKVVVKNNCYEEVKVAVKYLSLDGNWVTEGWFSVSPKDKSNIGVYTKNKILYFYAYSDNKMWNGDHNTSVSETNFVHLGNYPFTPKNKKQLKFKEKNFNLGSASADFEINLTCSK